MGLAVAADTALAVSAVRLYTAGLAIETALALGVTVVTIPPAPAVITLGDSPHTVITLGDAAHTIITLGDSAAAVITLTDTP